MPYTPVTRCKAVNRNLQTRKKRYVSSLISFELDAFKVYVAHKRSEFSKEKILVEKKKTNSD